jgi:hypothetical protein
MFSRQPSIELSIWSATISNNVSPATQNSYASRA